MYVRHNKSTIKVRPEKMDNKKTECFCGGLYSYKNKAKHMRTSRHKNFINSQNQVEILYESIMKLSEEDKLLLFAKLNIAEEPEVEIPEPETPEETKLKEGIKKLTEAYGEDVVQIAINSVDETNPNISQKEFDDLQMKMFEIENMACNVLSDDVEDIVDSFLEYLTEVEDLKTYSGALPAVVGFSKSQRQQEFEYGDIVKFLVTRNIVRDMKEQIDYLSRGKNVKALINQIPNEENRRVFVKGCVGKFIREGQDKIIARKDSITEAGESIQKYLLQYPFFKKYPTNLT